MCENSEKNQIDEKEEKSDKLVSVIVPVYNVEQYLEKCVNSIRNQTYKNLEIILVDDGTPDDSDVLCDVLAKIDDRIKVIHKENGGLSDARNAGLDVAEGEYIAFVDGDDFIHPKMYETMVHVMEEDGSDMVLCEYAQVDENADIDEELEVAEESTWRFRGRQLQQLYFEDGCDKLMVVAWNKLYKAELFADIRYPVGLLHEDEFTTCKITYPCQMISYIPTPFYYYVTRTNSIMGVFNEKRFDLLLSYIERMCYFATMKEYALTEAFAKRYMRMTNQYRAWGEKTGQDFSEKLNEYREIFMDAFAQCLKEKRIKFTVQTKAELFAYLYMKNIYYKLWKQIHR